MAFTVIRGDIAAESADAPVNAAGTSLRMESGVAVTDAYDLDAEYGPRGRHAPLRRSRDTGGVP